MKEAKVTFGRSAAARVGERSGDIVSDLKDKVGKVGFWSHTKGVVEVGRFNSEKSINSDEKQKFAANASSVDVSTLAIPFSSTSRPLIESENNVAMSTSDNVLVNGSVEA